MTNIRIGRFCLAVGLTLALTSQAASFVTYESITVATVSIGITAAILDPPGFGQMTNCMARLETAQIRYRFDGTAPTSAEGAILEIGDQILLDNHADADRIRFIRTGAVSGVLKVHCWRP